MASRQLRRNVLVYGLEGFEGEWVAVPREDFDAVRDPATGRTGAAFAVGGLAAIILTALEIGPMVIIVITLCGALVINRLERME